MTAYACIPWEEIPKPLADSCRKEVEEGTRATLALFNGYPFAGQINETSSGLQVEFLFSRDAQLRNALVDWLMYWGISFTVVM
jgi:hypothetical protein